MKTQIVVILFFALVASGAISSSFLLAVVRSFEPERTGFFRRWVYYTWRNCIPAGIVAALLFAWIYRGEIAKL